MISRSPPPGRPGRGKATTPSNHRNCLYSGVYYFNGDEQTGKIQFNNPFRKSLWVESTKFNELNMDQFRIRPHRNLLIFFPSYMDHAVQEHQSDAVRYSIAFNLIPVGQLGMEDSAAYIEVPARGAGEQG